MVLYVYVDKQIFSNIRCTTRFKRCQKYIKSDLSHNIPFCTSYEVKIHSIEIFLKHPCCQKVGQYDDYKACHTRFL